MRDFRDKNLLVTGAASGIGRATALAFAVEGANLIIADINEEGLKSVAVEIERLGRSAMWVRTDVSKPEEVASLAQISMKEAGGVDVLVNNAGVGLSALIRDMDLIEWEWILSINLWGAIYMIHYLLPHMIERSSGHIINVASGTGLIAAPIIGAYSTTKFALVGLSEALRAELAHHNIGVSVVCPGFVRTSNSHTSKVKDLSPKIKEELQWKFKGLSPKLREESQWIRTTPEKVARTIIKGVKRNQAKIIVTQHTKILVLINRFLPGLIRALSCQIAKRIEKERRVETDSGS